MMMLSHDDGHQDAHDAHDDAHDDEDNDIFDKQELIGGSGLKITNYN